MLQKNDVVQLEKVEFPRKFKASPVVLIALHYIAMLSKRVTTPGPSISYTYNHSVSFYFVQIRPVVHEIWLILTSATLLIVTCDVMNALNNTETMMISLWTL